MKIIHYSLGFPPYRSGGMTKFCTDLMMKQVEQGHDVSLLWPGRITLRNRKVKVIQGKNRYGIRSLELVNPLPISLNGGIADISLYTKKCRNPEAFEHFLEEYRPDVLHFHTFMGVYKEFLEIAKKKGIRMVCTTHDYFGICPKLTMFRNGAVCTNVSGCENCPQCNKKALTKKKIYILQSPIYRKLKDVCFVKAFRRKFRANFFHEKDQGELVGNTPQVLEYQELRKHYMEMFELMDRIHFNSQMTKEVFLKYAPQLESKGEVVVISHNDIRDRRKELNPGEVIRLGFASLQLESKGYRMMLQALDELWEEGNHWFQLHLYGKEVQSRPYIVEHNRFTYAELEQAYDNMDVLLMPSIWYETFGLVVLEALSFGVPVIITENVGCKELIKDGEQGIIIPVQKEALKKAVKSLQGGETIKKFNRNILQQNMDVVGAYLDNIEKLYR